MIDFSRLEETLGHKINHKIKNSMLNDAKRKWYYNSIKRIELGNAFEEYLQIIKSSLIDDLCYNLGINKENQDQKGD
jgi:hypothetical protein